MLTTSSITIPEIGNIGDYIKNLNNKIEAQRNKINFLSIYTSGKLEEYKNRKVETYSLSNVQYNENDYSYLSNYINGAYYEFNGVWFFYCRNNNHYSYIFNYPNWALYFRDRANTNRFISVSSGSLSINDVSMNQENTIATFNGTIDGKTLKIELNASSIDDVKNNNATFRNLFIGDMTLIYNKAGPNNAQEASFSGKTLGFQLYPSLINSSEWHEIEISKEYDSIDYKFIFNYNTNNYDVYNRISTKIGNICYKSGPLSLDYHYENGQFIGGTTNLRTTEVFLPYKDDIYLGLRGDYTGVQFTFQILLNGQLIPTITNCYVDGKNLNKGFTSSDPYINAWSPSQPPSPSQP